jgi:2-C-methyl-D-erythritol 4-phosphate cytidylyltransferase/2-C-methyl-D-erythritol 2,4-cyclodiphosphate synthase
MIAALILAAGSSSRFGRSMPKQFCKYNNEIILNWVIHKFANNPRISHIQVVISQKDIALYQSLVKPHPKLLPFCYGGDSRQQSAFNGLMALESINPSKVLIHDAARPHVDSETINEVISKLAEFDAVDLAIEVTDTIKSKSEQGITPLVRDQLYGSQTPQGFDYKALHKAHIAFESQNFTDDVSLMLAHGHQIGLVVGKSANSKITYGSDISKVMRVGMGYDVHRLSNSNDKGFIKLCGVEVPHHQDIIAHSDGDVVLHAVTDAILGSIAMGDIGEHFPPTDEKWRNVDSKIFLLHAVNLLKKMDGEIINIDVTIICQTPKISPYRILMQHSLADMLELLPSQVALKATTTEGLGFTGRKEGIAAQAICTILT